jgi:1,4-alpha-glucan branching enzyme
MLPFSHDEVVHGKSPVIYKMHGNEQEKFAQLRLLYAFMFLHPGAKLLFMGNEFGQTSEWDYSKELDWELLQFDTHNLLQECVRDLNIMYKSLPALHQLQFNRKGFQWEQLEDEDPCLMAFRRKTKKREQDVLVIVNAGPRSYVQKEWHISGKNQWKEIFNTNDRKYCGTGGYMNDYIPMQSLDKKRRSYILKLNIPAFSVMVFY